MTESSPANREGGESRTYRVEDPDTHVALYRSRLPEGASFEDMRRLRGIDAKFNSVLLLVNSLKFRETIRLVKTEGPYGAGVRPTYDHVIQKSELVDRFYMDHLEEKAAELNKWADDIREPIYPDLYQQDSRES